MSTRWFYPIDPLLTRTLFVPAEDPARWRASNAAGLSERSTHAREHPPRLPDRQGALRVRSHLGDAVHARRSASRHLQQLPSVLHRKAEADRHARTHRPLQEEVRERAGDAAAEEGHQGCGQKGRKACQESQEGSRKGVGQARHEGPPGGNQAALLLSRGPEGGVRESRKKNGGGGRRGRGGETRPSAAATARRDHFSRAATWFKPSSSRSTRSRPWFARSPSRFILLIKVETNEREAPTRSARSCWVIPCRHSSFPGAMRSPCACARASSISASRAGTSFLVSPSTRCRSWRTRSLSARITSTANAGRASSRARKSRPSMLHTSHLPEETASSSIKEPSGRSTSPNRSPGFRIDSTERLFPFPCRSSRTRPERSR